MEYREGDLTQEDYKKYNSTRVMVVDCETTGLEPLSDTLKVILVEFPEWKARFYIQLQDEVYPFYFMNIYNGTSIKLFHYAYFDMRFIAKRYNIIPKNIGCTKMAAKILDPNRLEGSQSLQALLERYQIAEIEKNKDIQLSGWDGVPTEQMLLYAADDVQYVEALHLALVRKMNLQQANVYSKALSMLPTMVHFYLEYNKGLYGY